MQLKKEIIEKKSIRMQSVNLPKISPTYCFAFFVEEEITMFDDGLLSPDIIAEDGIFSAHFYSLNRKGSFTQFSFGAPFVQ